jgi:hypothetical protein
LGAVDSGDTFTINGNTFDATLFKPEWIWTSATDHTTERLTQEHLDNLYRTLTGSVVYGTTPEMVITYDASSGIPLRVERPNEEKEAEKLRAYNERFPKKETEMEIGGDKCHLCGGEKMYQSTDFRVSPHHVHRSCHMVYQCGTEILRSWRDDECGVKDRWQQNIHVGTDCIEVD